MVVMKFGGTSVEDATAIRNLINIVRNELPHQPMVVVSACSGITNKLIATANAAAAGKTDEAFKILSLIKAHHHTVITDLNIVRKSDVLAQLDNYCSEIENMVRGVEITGELTARSLDTFSSFGELLSSMIIAPAMNDAGIKTQWIDARRLLITDDAFGKAQPLWDITAAKLSDICLPLLQSGTVVLTQGFIGSTKLGRTTTLGRGGSDYSASIFGSLLHAKNIQIWTDVDGVLTADPRIVPEAKRLKVMTFNEAAELAYYGAKVLHPATIQPAVSENISVFVLNSKHPESEGTLITSEVASQDGLIKSIAYKKGQAIVTVRTTKMLGTYGFLPNIFGVFTQHETPVDMIATSEISVSVTVSDVANLEKIVSDLKKIADVEVEKNVVIICVVGDNLKHTAGVAGRIFNAIRDINVRMISQGASDINVGFVVSESDLETVVRRLHHEFFADMMENEIFGNVLSAAK
jgi:aspartate kinase